MRCEKVAGRPASYASRLLKVNVPHGFRTSSLRYRAASSRNPARIAWRPEE